MVSDRVGLGVLPAVATLETQAVPARIYAALAATVFAIIAILQLVRALQGWQIVVGSTDIPVGASWVACIGAVFLAVLGFLAAIRD
jgi:hypothetical protein